MCFTRKESRPKRWTPSLYAFSALSKAPMNCGLFSQSKFAVVVEKQIRLHSLERSEFLFKWHGRP